MVFNEMNDNQRRIFIDAAQLYEAFMAVHHKSRAYRGGMHWKKAKGRNTYLDHATVARITNVLDSAYHR